MKKILVIDDEPDIVEIVSYNLRKEGLQVDTALDGEKALNMIRSTQYSLIILDLMLPGLQGIEICRIIRGEPATADLPVIMLTAKGEEIDKILGLEIGADDYITKPFSPRELAARTKAVLRRSEARRYGAPVQKTAPKHTGVIKIRDMTIDKERYSVHVGSRLIRLSAIEFKLLAYLAEKPNRIFSRDQLLDTVWGDDVYVEPRTVDVHIRRLRTKIEEDPNNPTYIKTMRGVGYYVDMNKTDPLPH